MLAQRRGLLLDLTSVAVVTLLQTLLGLAHVLLLTLGASDLGEKKHTKCMTEILLSYFVTPESERENA